MAHLLKEGFGGALSNLKMKNIDTASLHEIIGEFAPLIGMDSDETSALKSHSVCPEPPNHTIKMSTDHYLNVANGHYKEKQVKQEPESNNGQAVLDLLVKSKEVLKNNASKQYDTPLKSSCTSAKMTQPTKTEGSSTDTFTLQINPLVIDRSSPKNSDQTPGQTEGPAVTLNDLLESDESSLDTLPDSLFDDQEISEKSLRGLYEVKTVYDLKYFQCKLCPKTYDTKYHLNRHLISHGSNRPHRCSVCAKTFSQKCDMNRHMSIHNELRKHACSVCNKSFKRADYLSKHERQYCGVLKPHKCTKCSKGFEDIEQLNEHIRSHNESTFYCEHCSEEFNSVDSLVVHRKKHSKKNEEYTCTKCGQQFTDFTSYVDHFKAHSGERPYTCDLCKKVFSRNHNLMTHMWIHNQEKQHTCPICAKTFTYYSNLQVHLRVHRNERPYKCEECDKGFLTSSDLRRHKRTHSGEKPYKCSQCSAMYARKERLISHMVTHMEEGTDEREAPQHLNGGPSVIEEEITNITGNTERDIEDMEEDDEDVENTTTTSK